MDIYNVETEPVNDRYYYTHHFGNTIWGIWWCGSSWIMGHSSFKGHCQDDSYYPLGYSNNKDQCVHTSDNTWNYYNVTIDQYVDAENDLTIQCTSSDNQL